MALEWTGGRLRVVCRECPFSEVVDNEDEERAAVVVEHGRETGHKLSTEPVDPAE